MIAEKLAGFIIKFRIPIIIGTILLVIGFAFFIQFLNFENDMTLWVDKNSEIGRMPHYINETFGNSTPLLIAVKMEDLFTYDNLSRLQKLAADLKKIEQVEEVLSLTTVDDIVPTEYGLKIEKLIPDRLPDGSLALESLRSKILANKNYKGRLVSPDGTVAMIIIKTRFGSQADKVATVVRTVAESVFHGTTAELYFSGNPFLLNSISRIVFADFVFLIPLVTLIVLGVLFLSFKSMRGVLLPLLAVLFSTTMMMGIMSLLNVPLNMMSSAVPVILIAVGSAYGIHVINNYNEQITRLKDKSKIIAGVIKDVGLPVVMAGLTTMAGFLSNITAEVSIVKTFGIFTAVGVALSVLIALFFIPSILYTLKIKPPKKLQNKKKTSTGKSSGIFDKLSATVIKRKIPVLAGFGVIVLVCGFFAAFITAKVDILGYFSKDSEPQTASRFVTKHFGGFNPLNIYIKADAADPDVLKTLVFLEEYLKAFGELPAPSSAAGIVTELNNAMTGFYTIPETKAEVENLLFFVDGQETISSMMTKEKNETLVSVLVPSIDNIYLQSLFDYIELFLDKFRKGIIMEENNPRHPALLQAEHMLIGNLLSEEHIQKNDVEIAETIAALSEVFANAAPKTDISAVYRYAVSDEAEIIMEDEEARILTGRIAAMKTHTFPGLIHAVKASFLYPADVTDDEIEWFAKSLLQRLQESGEKNRLALLVRTLEEKIPELKQTSVSAKAYTLAPFLWKTIPVNMVVSEPQRAGVPAATGFSNDNSIRNTPVETMEISGTARLIEDMRKSIFFNQIISILIALAAVFILNTLTFKSVKEGMVSLAAIITTIMVNFGIMGIFNIPLDFVTAIIAGVAIGTGIDYTIHFISRFSSEMKKTRDVVGAYKTTLVTAGKGIIFNAAAVALGFAVLLGSNIIPLRTVGILLAATMVTSSISALTLMPALLLVIHIFEKKRVPEIIKTKKTVPSLRSLREILSGFFPAKLAKNVKKETN
ncbi:MAG: MMPL family transporter [Spirochaetales bacterium]|nr:MMPL family transporter [Spirochaetales bacterium]